MSADKNLTVPDGCEIQTNSGLVKRDGSNAACSIVVSGLTYSFKNYFPDLFLISLDNRKGNWEYYVNGNYASVSLDKYFLNSGDILVLTFNGASPSLPVSEAEVKPKELVNEGWECAGEEKVWLKKYNGECEYVEPLRVQEVVTEVRVENVEIREAPEFKPIDSINTEQPQTLPLTGVP